MPSRSLHQGPGQHNSSNRTRPSGGIVTRTYVVHHPGDSGPSTKIFCRPGSTSVILPPTSSYRAAAIAGSKSCNHGVLDDIVTSSEYQCLMWRSSTAERGAKRRYRPARLTKVANLVSCKGLISEDHWGCQSTCCLIQVDQHERAKKSSTASGTTRTRLSLCTKGYDAEMCSEPSTDFNEFFGRQKVLDLGFVGCCWTCDGVGEVFEEDIKPREPEMARESRLQ